MTSAQGIKTDPQLPGNDSLSLPQILQTVLQSYPTVVKAQETINAAGAAIGLARSGYYPVVEADAGYTRIDPVPSVSFPGLGDFNFAPNNNYNTGVSVYETLYDFEKTARNIRLQESTKKLSEKNVELIRQKLTLVTSVSYYSLIYLQEAIKIKETQIATLKKHLAFVTKKAETGSSTQYEVLSTQVRLSNAENQKVDIETSRQTQTAILNSLLGWPVSGQLKVRSSFLATEPGIRPDSLITYALEHRYELVMARLRQEHAELNLKSVKVQYNPSIGAFIDGGFKNGYFPDLNKFQINWAGGVGLKVPVFEATRHTNNMKIASSEISMTKQDLEETTRNVSTEVFQNQVSLQASLKKIDQGSLQVKQAEEALNLAVVSFKSGAITNLDLLDAETALEESRVSLLKDRIDYAINLVRLNISVGKPIQ
jgi:outer membrane protein TolC